MLIYEMATKDFETKDDIVVEIANAITEVKELETSCSDYKDEVERLEDEVVRLKEKNLELLSMIPIAEKETEKETEETEELTIKDIYSR